MRFSFFLCLYPGSPLKRFKANVDVISHGRPSMARFKVDQNIGLDDVDFEFHPATNNLSPIVPVRLSQRFIDEVGFFFCGPL